MVSDQKERDLQKNEKLDPAPVARATLIVVAIVGVAWLMIELTQLLLLVFASITIAAIFDVLASGIRRKTGIGQNLALSISVATIIALFVGAFALFGTQIAREFATLQETLPAALKGFEAFLDRYGLGDQARNLIRSGSSDASELVSRAGGYALAAGSGLADFVLVLVGAIFLASNPAVYRRGLLLLLPSKAEAPVGAALDDARKGLTGWMLGQAISSLVVGALTWIGLMFLGVPASGGLAIIAGLLDVIPMVGPVIAGVPAVLLAFTVSPMAALWTLMLFVAIQQLQGNFLQPMIQKRAVDVPPAVLLFAVFAFGILFGFLGILLAAPLTVVVFVAVRRLYVKDLMAKSIGGLEDN
ncbi:AI-2E family transporter [Sphingorhabdus sp.]|uniref:AI-2E family transporter n=1 Tax=Sphingorhabdus sp. TaxID=1902408 RepID=UPI002FDAF7D1